MSDFLLEDGCPSRTTGGHGSEAWHDRPDGDLTSALVSTRERMTVLEISPCCLEWMHTYQESHHIWS